MPTKTKLERATAIKDEQEPAWSIPGLREPRYSQSLERGLAILACFTAKRPVLGIADIADELGMSRSTTHRYVITLVALGYLEQGASRKYRLGLRVTDLGMSALNSTDTELPTRGAQCGPEPPRRLAAARPRYGDGQAAAREPSGDRAARTDRADEAHQTRPQHDHQQEGAA